MDQATMDQVKDLGYEVEEASEEQMNVRGFGVDMMIPADDTEAWERFLIPEAHKNREDQAKSSDTGDPFTMTEREEMESALNAAVGVGDMTQADADKALADYDKDQAK